MANCEQQEWYGITTWQQMLLFVVAKQLTVKQFSSHMKVVFGFQPPLSWKCRAQMCDILPYGDISNCKQNAAAHKLDTFDTPLMSYRISFQLPAIRSYSPFTFFTELFSDNFTNYLSSISAHFELFRADAAVSEMKEHSSCYTRKVRKGRAKDEICSEEILTLVSACLLSFHLFGFN